MVGPEAEHSGIIRAGRAIRRGDGHRGRAQDRAHRQPRLGRRVLRDGGAGIRSRLHPLLAHRPHGRDGGRIGGHGGARRRDREGPEGAAPSSPPRRQAVDRARCAPTTSSSSTPGTPRRAGYVDAIVTPEETRDHAGVPAAGRPPTTRARTSGPSSFRRSTRRPLAGAVRLRALRSALRSRSPVLRAAGAGRRRRRAAASTQCRRPPDRQTVPRPPRPDAGPSPSQPIVPPEAAYAHGWMPLASHRRHRLSRGASRPTTDAACSSPFSTPASMPGVPGLDSTSTGDPSCSTCAISRARAAVAARRVHARGRLGRRSAAGGSAASAGSRALNTAGPVLRRRLQRAAARRAARRPT